MTNSFNRPDAFPVSVKPDMKANMTGTKGVSGKRTMADVGRSEPGFDAFAAYRKRGGSSDDAITSYAQHIGMVRTLSKKPLLNLTVPEVEALDTELLGRALSLRTVLKMFYRGCRSALLDALPRQRRQQERRIGLDGVLMPDDVTRLIDGAGNLRDKALIAVLASTGGRINEVLHVRLKDIQNGSGYQVWFGQTKVRSQERFSPRIEGVFKDCLDAWLAVHPSRGNPEAPLFPSTVRDSWVNETTVSSMLTKAAKKAGVTKNVNAHAFRHARVTWGIIGNENTAKLCIGIWGKASSAMLNKYNHFAGLDAKLEPPQAVKLEAVPALPVPPILSTQAHVAELTARLDAIEHGVDGYLKQRAAALGLSAALDAPAPQGVLSTEQKEEVVARRTRRARQPTEA